MMFTKIKAKLWAFGGLVLAILAGILRMRQLESQRDKARHKAKVYQGRAEQAAKVQKADAEIEEQTESRRQQASEEIKSDGIAKNLGEDSNDW